MRTVFEIITEYIIYQGCWSSCYPGYQWQKGITCHEIIEFSGKIMSVMIKEIYVKISKKVTNFIFFPNLVKINIQLGIEGPDICCWRSINNSNQNIFVNM